MKKITLKWLKKWDTCQKGIDLWKQSGITDVKEAINGLIEIGKFSNAQWLLCRALPTKAMRIQYAAYCAEQRIKIYEGWNKIDKRPRNAIQAAKRYIKNPTQKNKSTARSAASAAWSAARSAVDSAVESAAWSAAWSARSAAWSAESVTERAASAVRSAESAAWSAARSAAWSAARSAAESEESVSWSAAWSAAQNKMLKYGIKLLYFDTVY